MNYISYPIKKLMLYQVICFHYYFIHEEWKKTLNFFLNEKRYETTFPLSPCDFNFFGFIIQKQQLFCAYNLETRCYR